MFVFGYIQSGNHLKKHFQKKKIVCCSDIVRKVAADIWKQTLHTFKVVAHCEMPLCENECRIVLQHFQIIKAENMEVSCDGIRWVYLLCWMSGFPNDEWWQLHIIIFICLYVFKILFLYFQRRREEKYKCWKARILLSFVVFACYVIWLYIYILVLCHQNEFTWGYRYYCLAIVMPHQCSPDNSRSLFGLFLTTGLAGRDMVILTVHGSIRPFVLPCRTFVCGLFCEHHNPFNHVSLTLDNGFNSYCDWHTFLSPAMVKPGIRACVRVSVRPSQSLLAW